MRGVGIQFALDEVRDGINLRQPDAQCVSDDRVLPGTQLGEVVTHYVFGVWHGHSALRQVAELNEQALTEIPCTHANWLERLQHVQYAANALFRYIELIGDVANRPGEVTALVEAAHQQISNPTIGRRY